MRQSASMQTKQHVNRIIKCICYEWMRKSMLLLQQRVSSLLNWWHIHYDVIKWKHYPRYWPFVRGIHRSPVNSPHKGQWRGALMFSLICAWTNGWVNNVEAGDLRRHRTHYDVTVMVRQWTGLSLLNTCQLFDVKLSTGTMLKIVN